MSVLFKNITALKSALKIEHDLAMEKLRKYKPSPDEFHYKFFRSRGFRIIEAAKNGKDNRGHSRFYDGQWEWDGTKKSLENAILQAISDGYETLYIDEGFDAAERIEDWDNSNYEPCVDEYEVCVWSKDGFDNGMKVVWGEFSVPMSV